MLKLVSVKDVAVDCFMTPTFVQHVGAAIREFTDCANDAQHHFCKHAKDYELFELGEYDEVSGFIKSHKSPRLLTRAIDVRKVDNDLFNKPSVRNVMRQASAMGLDGSSAANG